MIKQLYTVKHTSAGRDIMIPPPIPNKIKPFENKDVDSLPVKSDAA